MVGYLKLNKEQQKGYDMAIKGHNVFLTGVAGTGKSFTLNYIINRLKPYKNVYVTASTGTAAYIINGKTLHSWIGATHQQTPVDIFIKNMKSKTRRRIRQTNVLIIDEISMIHGEFLDKVNEVCKRVRYNDKEAFGGIQVIFCGDMAQLPPVSQKRVEYDILGINESQNHIDYAFFSNAWKDANLKIVYLNEIVRQKEDKYYVEILTGIREGRLTYSHIQTLMKQIGKRWDDEDEDGLYPTQLVPTKKTANRINKEEYDKLNTHEESYKAKITSHIKQCNSYHKFIEKINERLIEHYKKFGIMYMDLQLKIGSVVILTQNLCIEKGLYNGAQGQVIDFYNNIPINSVHKYIIETNGMEDEKILSSSYKIHEIQSVNNLNYPLVHFQESNLTIFIKPMKIRIKSDFSNTPDGYVEIRQLPLIPAWALTIHKSQGMTLDRARIDSGIDIFSSGQTYTALSRVRGLQSLSLIDFDPDKIKIDPIVTEFYDRIRNNEPLFSPRPVIRTLPSNSITEIFTNQTFTNKTLDDHCIKYFENYYSNHESMMNTIMQKVKFKRVRGSLQHPQWNSTIKKEDIFEYFTKDIQTMEHFKNIHIEYLECVLYKNQNTSLPFQHISDHDSSYGILYIHLGDTRNMIFRHHSTRIQHTVSLKGGDAILFTKKFNQTFEHSIRRESKPTSISILLSFRIYI